ncbi:MAG: TVP38/TMEM64 family protein, partial [Actinobacteria bacterium]
TAWASAAISTFTSADEFRDWVEGFGAWGPLVFLGAQAIQVIVAPVPGAVFPPVGSLAFGPWPALVLSLAGMAIGSAVVFLAARRWGRPLALRLAGKENVDKYEGLIEARGNILLWLVFLLPLLPDDAVCALAGVSRIPFRRFMLIAVVGRVPAVAAGVFAMAGLERAPGWVWVVASVVALLLMWAGTKVRRGIEQRIISENEGLRDEVSAADGGD